MTLRENNKKRKMEGGYGGEKIAERIWKCKASLFAFPPFDPLQSSSVIFITPLQILVFVFEGAAACGDNVGVLHHLLVLFCLQDCSEEPEDGVETRPGGQLVALCAYNVKDPHVNISMRRVSNIFRHHQKGSFAC